MESLGTTVRKLVEALDGGVQAHYDALGLDFRPRFYPVVRLLQAGQPLSIRLLASASGVSHSALSQTVSEMRAAGLVASSPGPDGRERLVELTDAGRAACDRMQALWAAVARAAASLDAELPMPLADLLRQALNRLEHQSFAARIERELADSGPQHRPTQPSAGSDPLAASPI